MVSKEELQKKYAALDNNSLLDIVENKFDYTDLAVIVALEEIAKRNLTEADITQFKNGKMKEAEDFIVKNIVDDLTFFQKNLFFFIWVPFLNFAFKRRFMEDGFVLKLKQANYYSWLGFVSLIAIGIAQGRFNFGNFALFGFWIIGFLVSYSFDEHFNRQRQIEKLGHLFEKPNEENKEE